MAEDRFNSLGLLIIEMNLSDEIDSEVIVNKMWNETEGLCSNNLLFCIVFSN